MVSNSQPSMSIFKMSICWCPVCKSKGVKRHSLNSLNRDAYRSSSKEFQECTWEGDHPDRVHRFQTTQRLQNVCGGFDVQGSGGQRT